MVVTTVAWCQSIVVYRITSRLQLGKQVRAVIGIDEVSGVLVKPARSVNAEILLLSANAGHTLLGACP